MGNHSDPIGLSLGPLGATSEATPSGSISHQYICSWSHHTRESGVLAHNVDPVPTRSGVIRTWSLPVEAGAPDPKRAFTTFVSKGAVTG